MLMKVVVILQMLNLIYQSYQITKYFPVIFSAYTVIYMYCNSMSLLWLQIMYIINIIVRCIAHH